MNKIGCIFLLIFLLLAGFKLAPPLWAQEGGEPEDAASVEKEFIGAAPEEASAAEAAPVEAAPVEAVSVETAPAQILIAQAAPEQAFAGQSAPAEIIDAVSNVPEIGDRDYNMRRLSSIDRELDKAFLQARQNERELKDQLSSMAVEKEEKVFSPSQITKYILPEDKRDAKISLDFSDAALIDVVNVITSAAGMNIILDPALKDKKVSLHLENVRLEDALRLLYNAYGLDSSLVGNSLFISTKEKIRQDNIQTKLIKLVNLDVDEAKALIKNVVDIVNVSKEINAIIVMGTYDEISKVQEILGKADNPQPLVVMETRIIEISRDGLKEIGVDWSDSATLNFQETKIPTTLATTAAGFKTAPFRIHKLTRDALEFSSIIKMLENQNKAKTLANPRITTLNNKESEIFVGDRIPYTITTVTGGVATTEVRFTEPGIRLKITPSIIGRDFVVIKIRPEVSSIYSWRGADNQYPWVKTREATAYVRVKDSETFVLGGLINNEAKYNVYEVPFLSRIPFLGEMFKYKKEVFTDTELIITVTPTIVLSKEE